MERPYVVTSLVGLAVALVAAKVASLMPRLVARLLITVIDGAPSPMIGPLRPRLSIFFGSLHCPISK